MNNRNKMYRTNAKIKQYLIKQGFHSIYLFPHLRFIKDYHLDDLGFDAIGFKAGCKKVYLMQFKTQQKPSKSILQRFKELDEKYYIRCLWVTKFNRGKVVVYGECEGKGEKAQ